MGGLPLSTASGGDPCDRSGDTIGLIAPSGPARHPDEIEQGMAVVTALGFKVVTGQSGYAK
ncbi:hypothetical protein DSCO28_46770 [Desulfosarcina ovata subsp. sediminis]|uniref:LD-carboxypeptidase N-terminal domain-containing protein n=1 Tax=Desulfosarcina ovata subsp. sediminis TaxID=885957 RepID=A0A5K7ZVB6_9BACT|nr:hypothetical protein DSCO28_46770 [Desulfosarcina ovata subsp. sediminis]